MQFPKQFTWGAAAASYQIEGAAFDEGKGLSVWDMLCKQEGKISGGDSGERACDHYYRYKQDVELMNWIGLQGYRLSISWPRVIPNGRGKVNQKGLAFYDRLIDELLEKKIDPWVTLFHWDYPFDLYLKGGWLNRDSSDWFSDYTTVIINKLSDRVTNWITQNEIQCFIGIGHQWGRHAPGLKLPFRDVLTAAHNALLAHGKAVQVIRSRAVKKPKIGAALVGVVYMPGSNRQQDIKAAKTAMFSIRKKHCWNNTWFADPMILGKYPADGLKLFAEHLPDFTPSDMKIIAQPLDFYGVNIYTAEVVKSAAGDKYKIVPHVQGGGATAMEWPVVPESLYWGPRFLYDRYKLPIAITENGMANCDWIHKDGKVHDPQRIDFVQRHLLQFARAIDEGVRAEGYFLWSIMDNFEWERGYTKRFGIVYTDYKNQKRILKDSAYWYKDVIATNGQALDEK